MRLALPPPALRRILTAYTVNRLGSWLGLVALSLAVFDHTHSALAVAALLFAWQALPAFVVPALVARVEASKRRGELSRLYFFEALATAALAVLVSSFWLPAVLLLAALDGTAALAASALLRAEVARTARAEAQAKLAQGADAADGSGDGGGAGQARDDPLETAERSANAALNVAFSASFVIGPVLGGVVVAAAGAPTALLIDVGSFVICGAMLIDLYPHVEHVGEDTVRARLRAGWRHINEAPLLRALLLADAVALVFFQAAGPIEVAYAKATLHAGDRGYGVLVTAWGAGAVLGSIVFARIAQRQLAETLSGAAFVIALAYIGFSAAPSLALACTAAVLGGVGNGIELPSMISLVQRFTPQHLHGRLMGAVESLAALSLAVGLPLGGALVALGSPRIAFLATGLGTVATAAALLRISRRGRRWPRAADGDERGAAAERATAQLGESLPHGPAPH